MLKNIFKKKKPVIYLDSITVIPRTDFKRHFEGWGVVDSNRIDTAIRKELEEIFSLPGKDSITEYSDNDHALQVIVPEFQSGEALSVSLGDIGFPLLWRPKISVLSRIYNLKSGKTIATISVKEKMQWREYFSRVFSWRGILSFHPMFDTDDMRYLLYRACHKLLVKIKKRL